MLKKFITLFTLLILINIIYAEETPTPIVTFDGNESNQETPTPIVTFDGNESNQETPTPIVTFKDNKTENISNNNTQIEKISQIQDITVKSEESSNKNIFIGISILVLLTITGYFIFLKK